MEPFEKYERNGLNIEISYDSDPESPREWDNLGKMICYRRNYNLGDEQFAPSDFEGWNDLKKHLKEGLDAVVILPLGLYDHSGITMYVGENHDRWDGGQVGFIYATKEDVEAEFGKGDEAFKKAEDLLRNEVKTYDTYLRGEVLGYTITDPRTKETIDSCWGYYSVQDLKEDANSTADNYEHPRESVFAKKASVMHG